LLRETDREHVRDRFVSRRFTLSPRRTLLALLRFCYHPAYFRYHNRRFVLYDHRQKKVHVGTSFRIVVMVFPFSAFWLLRLLLLLLSMRIGRRHIPELTFHICRLALGPEIQ